MALRADLVAILKDVVGLVSRIEASISETSEHRSGSLEPAPVSARPPARSDAMASHSCDVGPAPAVTDERPAHPSADQPPVAALPPSDEPAVPPATPSIVQRSASQEASRPVLIPKATSKPKSKALDPSPGKIVGTVITHRGSVISVDIVNGVVECEGHPDWQTSLPVAAFLAHMRDGDLYNAAALAKVADMPLASFTGGVWRWQAELRKRGVEFETTALGCRLRRAGE